MKANKQDCTQIRALLNESIGQGRDISHKEAAALSGIHWRNLYAVMSGQTKDAVAHLPALLNIPPFAERYMAAKGYACTHVGNEVGCAYEAARAPLEATGQIAPLLSDGSLSHRERGILARQILFPLIRKAVAYVHRFRRQEAGAQ